MIGVSVQKAILEEAVIEQGLDMESAKIDFLTFCLISSKFMTEEDEEGLKEELKEAFRIYDRDGQGFITTDVLKEILREICAASFTCRLETWLDSSRRIIEISS